MKPGCAAAAAANSPGTTGATPGTAPANSQNPTVGDKIKSWIKNLVH
jgi:hypothetical protein